MNGWENSHEAGDLRRHRAHYDVTVIVWSAMNGNPQPPEHQIRVHWQNPGVFQYAFNSVKNKEIYLQVRRLILSVISDVIQALYFEYHYIY